jgi:hypothetical protein
LLVLVEVDVELDVRSMSESKLMAVPSPPSSMLKGFGKLMLVVLEGINAPFQI